VSYLLLQSDARRIPLADGSVHCCVTSPPYFSLRDYGTAKWVGGDPTCDHIGMTARTVSGGQGKQYTNEGSNRVYSGDCACGARRVDRQIGLEASPAEFVASMVAVFREVWRVLRDDGTCWLNLGDSYAGSWGNQGRKEERGTQRPINGPMFQNLEPYPVKASGTGTIPEGSGLKPKDLIGVPWRVAFALQEAGWFLRSDIVWAKDNAMPESVTDRPSKSHEYVFLLAKSERYFYDRHAIAEPSVSGHPSGNGFKREARLSYRDESGPRGNDDPWQVTETRNARSVWRINTATFKGAHFAVMAPTLAERCIKAGCPEGGIVFDPFAGAATTLVVATALGRHAIGCDLSPEYLRMARRRLERPHAPVERPERGGAEFPLFAAMEAAP
jgi:DNA modification methylase